MKNNFVVFLLSFTFLICKSQNKDKELKQEKDSTLKKYIVRHPIDEKKHIMWQKVVWEFIDLKQKKNYMLYYPTDTSKISSYRKSLFDVLILGIRKDKIKDVYSDGYFLDKLKKQELEETLVKVDTTRKGIEQFNSGEPVSPEYITKNVISAIDIRAYKIKGRWYFDRRISELKYEILAISPLALDITQNDKNNSDLVELFWVKYPDIRGVLFNQEVFNPQNQAVRYNFDLLLSLRMFSSIIYKEENQWEDRQIKDYIRGNSLFQLRESMRIKEKIRNFEQDIWHY